MARSFEMDGVAYDAESLTPTGKGLLDRLTFVQSRLLELKNQNAMLTIAKNTCIDDLKAEVIQKKSGVDLSSLFDPE